MHGHKDMEIVTRCWKARWRTRIRWATPATSCRVKCSAHECRSRHHAHEFNPNADQRTHLLQIWIIPDRTGGSASYEQKTYDASEARHAAPGGVTGQLGSVTIQQDTRLYAGLFDGAEAAAHQLAPGRLAYVHVARGAVTVNGVALREGDAAKISSESSVRIEGGEQAECCSLICRRCSNSSLQGGLPRPLS